MMIYTLLLCVGVVSAGVGRFRRGGYGRPEILPPPPQIDQGFPPPQNEVAPFPPSGGAGYERPNYPPPLPPSGGGDYGRPNGFTSVNVYDRQPGGGYGRPHGGYGRSGFGGNGGGFGGSDGGFGGSFNGPFGGGN